MKAYARIKLWEMCLDKRLFRAELEKIVSNSSRSEIYDVLIYCYEKYSDMHADVLFDIFSKYKKYSNPGSPVQTEHAELVN